MFKFVKTKIESELHLVSVQGKRKFDFGKSFEVELHQGGKKTLIHSKINGDGGVDEKNIDLLLGMIRARI